MRQEKGDLNPEVTDLGLSWDTLTYYGEQIYTNDYVRGLCILYDINVTYHRGKRFQDLTYKMWI